MGSFQTFDSSAIAIEIQIRLNRARHTANIRSDSSRSSTARARTMLPTIVAAKPRPHVFGEPSDPPRHYDGIVAFSQTDFTADLKKITAPVLVMDGDDDQIVPYADSAPLSAKLLKNGTLKTYKGFPHGMPTTQAETISADLLAFIRT